MFISKTKNLNKHQLLTLLNDFFAHFQTWGNQSHNPTTADLEKYLASNFQLSSNGVIICRNVNDYLNRFTHLRLKYAHFEVIGPLEEPLISGDDKIILQYELNLRSHKGEKRPVCIMAIATIKDNKFCHWQQITHEKETEHWD